MALSSDVSTVGFRRMMLLQVAVSVLTAVVIAIFIPEALFHGVAALVVALFANGISALMLARVKGRGADLESGLVMLGEMSRLLISVGGLVLLSQINKPLPGAVIGVMVAAFMIGFLSPAASQLILKKV